MKKVSMKKIFLLLLVIALILSSCSSTGRTTDDTGSKEKTGTGNAQTGISVGNKAPDFTLKNTDGTDVRLSDYDGKTVILNFFGVWCPWCVKEMPGFVKVYNEYKSQDVVLLVVDVGDTKSKLEDYLKENKFSIKPVMDTEKGSTAQLYNVNGFPETYILNKDRIIQKIYSGYTKESDLKDTLNKITGK